jgi:hypothetical protein
MRLGRKARRQHRARPSPRRRTRHPFHRSIRKVKHQCGKGFLLARLGYQETHY